MLAVPRFKRGGARKKGKRMTSPKIEIYTKWGCPYCTRAKALLDAKGAAYDEYDITMGGPRRAELSERAPGAATVPQIFIASAAVGGCDELYALDSDGKLDALLSL